MNAKPNALLIAWRMLYARRVAAPDPSGTAVVDHTLLAEVLKAVSAEGVRALPSALSTLGRYRDELAAINPDGLDADEALAYWINLYNAGALSRAGEARSHDYASVLRVPGAFSGVWATVQGVTLSLDDIEHGKIRRFKDPRIHGALVCGSVSCPTLSGTPFVGRDVDQQLDTQMRSYLSNGGAAIDRTTNTIRLSRILKWYGADFQRPNAMPTLRPARASKMAEAIRPWLAEDGADYVELHRPKIVFSSYDWALGCSIT